MKHGYGLGADRHQYVMWIISNFLMWAADDGTEIFIFSLHTDSFGWSFSLERGENQVIKNNQGFQ